MLYIFQISNSNIPQKYLKMNSVCFLFLTLIYCPVSNISPLYFQDMHAIYLESVKSPLASRRGYKLQYNWKKHDEDNMIFSQALPLSQLEDEYEEDSFCVNSDAGKDSGGLIMCVTGKRNFTPLWSLQPQKI